MGNQLVLLEEVADREAEARVGVDHSCKVCASDAQKTGAEGHVFTSPTLCCMEMITFVLHL